MSAERRSEIETKMKSFLECAGASSCAPARLLVAPAGGHGEAADVLVNEARSLGAQLLVVSSHGRSGVGRLVFGSFAECLLDKSPWPLLFLSKPQRRLRNPRRFLFPTDFSKASERALDKLLAFLPEPRAEVLLYHSVCLPKEALMAEVSGAAVVLPDNVLDEDARWAREEAQRWIAQREGNTRIHSIVQQTGPFVGSSVLGIAEREKCGVIALTAQSGAWARSLFGSIAYDVFRMRQFPVLVWGARALE
jgi:nucleotide-binding universal stress UspA family protein